MPEDLIVECNKILLPDPVYLNNSKLNDIETIDFDNDGYVDLILATSRDNPYYHGHGIQLLKNDNGTFRDNSNLIQEQWSNDIPNFYFIRTIDKNNDGRFDLVPDGFANWNSIQYGNDIHWLNIDNNFLKIN